MRMIKEKVRTYKITNSVEKQLRHLTKISHLASENISVQANSVQE